MFVCCEKINKPLGGNGLIPGEQGFCLTQQGLLLLRKKISADLHLLHDEAARDKAGTVMPVKPPAHPSELQSGQLSTCTQQQPIPPDCRISGNEVGKGGGSADW